MIKFISPLLFLLANSFNVFSQKTNVESLNPKLSVRFNILGIADPLDHNFSTGIEHRFNPKWSTGTDAAWVFYSNYVQNAKSANGVIVRPFIRYYPKFSNTFWETELHYKYVGYKMEDWLGKQPVNNVPTYEEFTNFNLQKHALGIHFKWGIEANLSSDKRFRFEYTNGLGVRVKWHRVKDGVYNFSRTFNNLSNETFVGPAFPVSCRFVYVIK